MEEEDPWLLEEAANEETVKCFAELEIEREEREAREVHEGK